MLAGCVLDPSALKDLTTVPTPGPSASPSASPVSTLVSSSSVVLDLKPMPSLWVPFGANPDCFQATNFFDFSSGTSIPTSEMLVFGQIYFSSFGACEVTDDSVYPPVSTFIADLSYTFDSPGSPQSGPWLNVATVSANDFGTLAAASASPSWLVKSGTGYVATDSYAVLFRVLSGGEGPSAPAAVNYGKLRFDSLTPNTVTFDYAYQTATGSTALQ